MNKTFKKFIMVVLCILSIIYMFGCTQDAIDIKEQAMKLIVDDGQGHKKFKMLSNAKIKNAWVDIGEDSYYFDGNGYLEISKWINDEYYVVPAQQLKKNIIH